MFSSQGGHLTNAMYHHGKHSNQIDTPWWNKEKGSWNQEAPTSVFSFLNNLVCLFSLMLNVPVKAMVMSGRSVRLTTFFSWACLIKNILSLVSDNSLSWISSREENGHKHYFMINSRESMGQGQENLDWNKPWIGILTQKYTFQWFYTIWSL